MAAHFDAAFFDMDGLLLDTERLARDAFQETFRSFGVPPDDELFLLLIGGDASDNSELLRNGLPDQIPYEQFSRCWSDGYARLVAEDVPVKAGVWAVLNELSSLGLRLAVATSTATPSAENKLGRAGLRGFFETVIGGDQVERGKPAPDIYLRAVEALGVAPGNCVAFEDSVRGVRAALAAGMTVVQVPDLVPPGAELRTLGHLVAGSLAEAIERVGLSDALAPGKKGAAA
ncbi:MAG: HAD family phosphatase [Pseudomonadota bacterium]